MPSASPLTTITPARARSAASCSATASPYGEGRRDPTIATLGPSGGGQRPRVLRSAGSIKFHPPPPDPPPAGEGFRLRHLEGGSRAPRECAARRSARRHRGRQRSGPPARLDEIRER